MAPGGASNFSNKKWGGWGVAELCKSHCILHIWFAYFRLLLETLPQEVALSKANMKQNLLELRS